MENYYWATVCRVVHSVILWFVCPVLSCPVGLSRHSVTLVYCGQTVAWIKMELDMASARPHCVRWGPSPAPPPKGAQPPFSAHVCCGQTAGWIKMPLGTEVGLRPDDIVLDGDPDELSPQKGSQQPPHFSTHVLRPNAWMDQDATWHGGSLDPSVQATLC